MDSDQEASKKIQELQIIEQHMNQFLMEKQSIQTELNECNNALSELGKTNSINIKKDITRM